MKGYYLFAPVEPGNIGPDSGVERKVRAQSKALNEDLDCELVILPPAEFMGGLCEKIIRRFPFTAAWRKWKYEGEFNDADFLYIRQVYHDSSFVRYLREIKKQNPKVRIVYEIPTYPYDKETKLSLSNVSFLIKERLAREQAARYFDRIVTFYSQDQIWGVPCLKLLNGFDFSSVILPSRVVGQTIHIISVSATAFWHGYDRFLEGLHQYYSGGGKENIVYHMVGNVLPEYREMVKRYNLDEHVVFHGKLFGEQLRQLYAKCLLGIDILGGHRKDFLVSSTLKSREYGAYGLPLITSSPVDYLPKDYPFQLLVPYDDSPVDIESVIRFYHGIYDGKDCNQVAAEIRSYAEARCDMKITMKPVCSFLLE